MKIKITITLFLTEEQTMNHKFTHFSHRISHMLGQVNIIVFSYTLSSVGIFANITIFFFLIKLKLLKDTEIIGI